MSSESEEGKQAEKGGFRFVDKRRFDSAGNERDDGQPLAASRQQEPDPPRAEPIAAGGQQAPLDSPTSSDNLDKREGPGADPEMTFISFFISPATKAQMKLGDLKPPQGIDVPVDKQAARQTIDILNMLKEKTQGNRNAEEDRMLEEILHSLRLSFVRAGGG